MRRVFSWRIFFVVCLRFFLWLRLPCWTSSISYYLVVYNMPFAGCGKPNRFLSRLNEISVSIPLIFPLV